MAGFLRAACTLVLAGSAFARPAIPVHPIANDFTVSNNNTINGTSLHGSPSGVAATSPAVSLPLSFANNLGGGAINAYLTGLDGDGAAFFLKADGTTYYPPNPQAGIPPSVITEDIAIPLGNQGATVTVNLPNFVSSGRIYFAFGQMTFATNNGPTGPAIVAPSFTNTEDPNANIDYGFVEFTWTPNGVIYSNLSYVDFVGLVIAQLVANIDGSTCQVKGLPSNAVSTICAALTAQGAVDGQKWSKSCQTATNGTPLRVLAPLHLIEIDSTALAGYYDPYVDAVWTKYTSEDLTVAAGSLGSWTGRVDTGTDLLTFSDGNTFAKPTINDILGCNSGPFANLGGGDATQNDRQAMVPRLCAAFVRSTYLLDGGNVQPDGTDVSQYYPSDVPTDWYSKIVHENEIDGKGYAFAYDDVSPAGATDVSGLCTGVPTSITFTVGGVS